MLMKSRVTVLFTFALIAGCGGSGNDAQLSSSEQPEQLPTRSVENPVCTDTATALPECWASSCELIDSNEQTEVFYGRSVVAFSNDGQLRQYLQAFENANCIAPAKSTTELLSDTTFELLPRVEGEDEGNIDGHIEFTLGEAATNVLPGWSGGEATAATPYDLTAENVLCFDSNVIAFHENGWDITVTGAPSLGIDYEGCLSPFQ
ncbi:hypothetical protein ABWH88_08780 [Marinobacter adhaerens]